MKSAIISFPGSNCEYDLFYLLRDTFETEPFFVDYRESSLPEETEVVMIPGGFSYGDYLRSGAIARFSPIMAAVKEFAEQGGLVIGICNGFQILTEAGLLPGTLRHNESLNFICKPEPLVVQNSDTPFTKLYQDLEQVTFPIAHGEGNYYCDEVTFAELQNNHQIVFTYVNNPNGSVHDIAGITNKAGNVLGMMPHPERASEEILGGVDGAKLFKSMIESVMQLNIA